MNSYMQQTFEEELPRIRFKDIRTSINPVPLAAPLGENEYLNKLFKNIEQIIEAKHKYVIISTHQYRLKDFFAFDKEKYADQMANKTKIGFKNCTCIEGNLMRVESQYMERSFGRPPTRETQNITICLPIIRTSRVI